LTRKSIFTGIALASLAALVWSGNFVIARSIHSEISPVQLSFFRWLTATIVVLPFAFRNVLVEWKTIRRNGLYFFWVALFGISLFNTFIYVAGHFTTAINLALIGTTSSPIMSVMLARIFLKERIGWLKIAGILVCIAGILILLSKGSIEHAREMTVSKGDAWVLVAAFCFAVYNILARKKPSSVSPVSFLFTIFLLGTLILLPVFVWQQAGAPLVISKQLVWAVTYLGIGASAFCYFVWNRSIAILGAGRTALFGNLIPIFSTMEAIIWLKEQFQWFHLAGMCLVFAGLLLSNLRLLLPVKAVI
jgi:drug/metabolite transporter (DMT)-like permease